MLRCAQWCYDLAWDAFGVPVGTYRRVVYLAPYTATLTLLMLDNGSGPWALGALPVVAAMWWAMPHNRRLCREDDTDQCAGRYNRVNARALAEAVNYVRRSLVATGVDVVMYRYVIGLPWRYVVAFTLCMACLLANRCLLVRPRDGDRFSLRRSRLANAT